MTSPLDVQVQAFGDGTVVSLGSGETVFKLNSHKNNPILSPQDLGLTWLENSERKIGAVFNGGAEVFRGKVILTPRCQRGYRKGVFFDKRLGRNRPCLENYISEVWPLVSEDGVHFARLQNGIIRGDGAEQQDFIHGIEDIRIVRCGQSHLLVGCGKIKPPFQGKNADRIAVYRTEDFVSITYQGMIPCFDSRNAVPFPEPIHGQYYMLLRFYPNIHLDCLEAGMDQLLAPTRHVQAWERIYKRRTQSLLLEAGQYLHEKEKIGPGTQLLKTDRGWLLIYHAVGEIDGDICSIYGLADKIKKGYSVCAALLDLDNPRKVLCRTRNPIYIPSAPCELYGDDHYPVDIPAVVFPAGAFVHKNKLLIYAGAGDKYVILLTCNLDKLVNYLWNYCRT